MGRTEDGVDEWMEWLEELERPECCCVGWGRRVGTYDVTDPPIELHLADIVSAHGANASLSRLDCEC